MAKIIDLGDECPSISVTLGLKPNRSWYGCTGNINCPGCIPIEEKPLAKEENLCVYINFPNHCLTRNGVDLINDIKQTILDTDKGRNIRLTDVTTNSKITYYRYLTPEGQKIYDLVKATNANYNMIDFANHFTWLAVIRTISDENSLDSQVDSQVEITSVSTGCAHCSIIIKNKDIVDKLPLIVDMLKGVKDHLMEDN